MRPFGAPKQLEKRRIAIVKMVEEEGMTASDAARRGQVSIRSVFNWLRQYREDGIEGVYAKQHPGHPPRLNTHQTQKLEDILLAGARASGFGSELWTCKRVAEVIQKSFRVEYNVDYVAEVLRRMGWTPQRPTTRAKERDEKKILGWRRRTWPRIKKSKEIESKNSICG